MTSAKSGRYVSRGGDKLAAALDAFGVDPTGLVCADLGCNVGGFVDCLLQRGAKRVFAIDTGYGALDYRFRNDDRVVVMERTNALHVTLPEPVDLVTIDVAWTRQQLILPAAAGLIRPESGQILALVKPHYEAPKDWLGKGVLPPERIPEVVDQVVRTLPLFGLVMVGQADSPVPGHGGNREVWLRLHSTAAQLQ